MTRSFALFVSSSPELVSEREALGQAVAELPVSIGWEIKHTARVGQDATEGLSFIADCDLFVVVLGSDFSAPMGLEWEQSQKRNCPMLAYRKDVLRSPSAQNLLRRSDTSWAEFDSAHRLRVRFSRDLAEYLLNRGTQFGLQLDDVEGLLTKTDEIRDDDTPEADRREGAGSSGIIFTKTPDR